MKRIVIVAVMVFTSIGCARLPTLTPDILNRAEEKWHSHRPKGYRLVIEMSGDRVETGRFEVEVESGRTVNLRRNGLSITPNPGEDYTMEGLFHMLKQELGLAEKPATIGAPPGYAVYLTAKFDDATGRLIRYRRIVGGTSNGIEVNVVEYAENQ